MKPSFTFQDKPYQAILFDMDGTLIDNMMIHHEAWRVALAEHGLVMTIEEVMVEIHGVNHEILARLFGDTFTIHEAKQFALKKEAAYRRIYADQITLIPGAGRFLHKAQELMVPMGVATAAPLENVDFVFRHLPIKNIFKAVKHAGDVNRGKPDPQVFEITAAALGADVSRCLVFEDSITGAEAARRAGADVTILTTTQGAQEFSGMNNIVSFSKDYQVLLDRLCAFVTS